MEGRLKKEGTEKGRGEQWLSWEEVNNGCHRTGNGLCNVVRILTQSVEQVKRGLRPDAFGK